MLNVKKTTAILRKSKKNISNINELSFSVLSEIDKVIHKSNRIDCHSGCSHCCYLRVSAYDFELISIYQYLMNEINKSDREKILKKLSEQYEIVKDLSVEEHHHRNIKCPFLIENKCSVYPVRPVSCAGYHSTKKELCIKSNEDPTDESFGIPRDIQIEMVKDNTHAFIQTFIDNSGEEVKELISGMHQLINNKSKIIQWQKGK
ncbi:YkgJ family cysteine cluster protein [Proteus faecis]|uniref:YkgJ family cysteine cluster protein n=1 Tax=Proteus faecis TaxID=2050967 RepID=UPI003075B9B2